MQHDHSRFLRESKQDYRGVKKATQRIQGDPRTGVVEEGILGDCYCCLATKSYLTLCSPVDCSTPGFPVRFRGMNRGGSVVF